MKVRNVLSVFLLFVCLFIPFRHSSSITLYQTRPCLRFGDWTIGQRSGSGNIINTSFLTNTDDTCCVDVSVRYCDTQPSQFVYPITSYTFVITMNNGFTVNKYKYETSGPDAKLLDPKTSFSVKAKLTGSGITGKVEACDGKNGRKHIPMKVSVTFTGTYGSNSSDPQTVTMKKTWTQDAKDLLRQEYVDSSPPGTRAQLPVPSKSDLKLTIPSNGIDGWNTGDHGLMIDDGLKAKKSAWLAKVNELYRTNLPAITDKQFIVNSAYRSPYHHHYHVNGSFHSRHLYGDALDVHTIDVDGDRTVEQQKIVYPKNATAKQKTAIAKAAYDNSDDGVAMEDAATAAGAKFTGSYQYYSTHTHADWTARGRAWPPKAGTTYNQPCNFSETTSGSTTTTSTTTSTTGTHNTGGNSGNSGDSNAQQPTPTPTMHACGVHASTVAGDHSYITPACGNDSHAGYACQISSTHTESVASGYRGSLYGCQTYKTYSCGHTDLNENGSDHRQKACPTKGGDRCIYHSYYVCSPHTHKFPEPIPKLACGARSWTRCSEEVSSTTQHQLTCVGGHPYWSCNPSAVASHATPIPCKRPGCNLSIIKCQNGKGGCFSNGKEYKYHNIY